MRAIARIVSAALLTLALQPASAEPDDLEKLLEIGDDAFAPVTRPLAEPPFYHHKWIRIEQNSLTNGWVFNRQCHSQFAAMPSLQIVFGTGTTRNIRLTKTKLLGRAWVEGTTVQLETVRPESEICFSSENRVLSPTGPGDYELKVGPFYYRYLDGYFPMQMILNVDYPPSLLKVVDVAPDQPEAIAVKYASGQIRLESVFQGKLWVYVKFAAVTDPLSKSH